MSLQIFAKSPTEINIFLPVPNFKESRPLRFGKHSTRLHAVFELNTNKQSGKWNYEWCAMLYDWLIDHTTRRSADPSIRRSMSVKQKSDSQEVACQCLPAWTHRCNAEFLFALAASFFLYFLFGTLCKMIWWWRGQEVGGWGYRHTRLASIVWHRRPMLIRFLFPTTPTPFPRFSPFWLNNEIMLTIWFDNCRTLFDVCRFLLTLLYHLQGCNAVFLRTKHEHSAFVRCRTVCLRVVHTPVASPFPFPFTEPDQFGLIRIGNLFGFVCSL